MSYLVLYHFSHAKILGAEIGFCDLILNAKTNIQNTHRPSLF